MVSKSLSAVGCAGSPCCRFEPSLRWRWLMSSMSSVLSCAFFSLPGCVGPVFDVISRIFFRGPGCRGCWQPCWQPSALVASSRWVGAAGALKVGDSLAVPLEQPSLIGDDGEQRVGVVAEVLNVFDAAEALTQ